MEPRSPTLQADSLLSEPVGKPKNTGVGSLSLLQRILFLLKKKKLLFIWNQCLSAGPHLTGHWVCYSDGLDTHPVVEVDSWWQVDAVNEGYSLGSRLTRCQYSRCLRVGLTVVLTFQSATFVKLRSLCSHVCYNIYLFFNWFQYNLVWELRHRERPLSTAKWKWDRRCSVQPSCSLDSTAHHWGNDNKSLKTQKTVELVCRQEGDCVLVFWLWLWTSPLIIPLLCKSWCKYSLSYTRLLWMLCKLQIWTIFE